MHQFLKFILFWNNTLHVSDGLSVKLVHLVGFTIEITHKRNKRLFHGQKSTL